MTEEIFDAIFIKNKIFTYNNLHYRLYNIYNLKKKSCVNEFSYSPSLLNSNQR